MKTHALRIMRAIFCDVLRPACRISAITSRSDFGRKVMLRSVSPGVGRANRIEI